ncbi:MAG: beta-ketoacyl synthase N-terminal-like domain-containing protein, partial [Clostridiales bacterium]
MEKRRVVITGMGTLNPIGNSTAKMQQSIRQNSCGIAKIINYDTSKQKVTLAGEIKDLNIADFIDKKESR